MVHTGQTEPDIRRVSEAITQSPLLARSTDRYELSPCPASLVAGARTRIAVAPEEVS